MEKRRTQNHMNIDEKIEKFLQASAFAVVGASEDVHKYGHKCYKCYLQHGRNAYPVNPHSQEILGNPVFKDLASLPQGVESISIITPPAVTETIIEDAIACGIKNIWMQPGAESQIAIDRAESQGLNVIAGGPCLLVVLGYRGI